jgi:hypothetical protein
VRVVCVVRPVPIAPLAGRAHLTPIARIVRFAAGVDSPRHARSPSR